MAHLLRLAAVPPDSEDPPITFGVLVADDDESIRSLLARYLANEGLTVETANSGREALARLREHPPDIVFLDVDMPGKTGLEVLAFIRDHGLPTAVIITTAYGTEDVVAEALRRGADDYLRKPPRR